MRGAIITFERHYGFKDMGSSRIRGKWLANYWPECEMFVKGRPYDFVIYQKVYWPEHAKIFKGIKILDFCEPSFLYWNHRRQETLENIDAVTCATEALAREFCRFTPTPESPRLLPGDEWLSGSECRHPKDSRNSERSPCLLAGERHCLTSILFLV